MNTNDNFFTTKAAYNKKPFNVFRIFIDLFKSKKTSCTGYSW